MSTLTSEPVGSMITRMFAEADQTHARFWEIRDALIAQGLTRQSPEVAVAARDAHLAIAPETGQLLYVLVRSRAARTVVEFGTSFGISALHIASGLRDNGGGRLITTEKEPNKVVAATRTLVEAGLHDLVEIREGNVLETLAADMPESIEMVFLDGADELYVDVLKLIEPRLAPAAIIVADNAWAPGYRDYVRGRGNYVSLGTDNRVELSLLADVFS
jgi:predicted O-methyltransferase YrrM